MDDIDTSGMRNEKQEGPFGNRDSFPGRGNGVGFSTGKN